MNITVGQRIKQARREKGLSQHDLAQITQVSQPTVANWENNAHAPRHGALGRIAQALDSSPSWILGEEGTSPINSYNASAHHHVPILEWPSCEADLNTGHVTGYIPALTAARRPIALRMSDPLMQGVFARGTVLILDRSDQTLCDGARYLISVDGVMKIRTYNAENNGFYSLPDNTQINQHTNRDTADRVWARAVMAVSQL